MTYIRVVIGPNLSEFAVHFIVEKPRLLHLCVVIALQDDCNKQLQKDEVYNESKAGEEGVGQEFLSTTDCGVTVLNVILIASAPFTVIDGIRLNDKGCLYGVPRISSGCNEENDERVEETLEVHMLIH